MGGWVGQLVGSYQITKYEINIDLIQIIQFCLQIDDLWIYLHAHTIHWSQSLAIEIMSITVHLFDFVTIYILCITANFRHFLTF